jgi:hypothetical protein
MFFRYLLTANLEMMLMNSMIAVNMMAAAYALSFTSGIGEVSWKNMARGKVAVGSSNE